MGHVQHHNAEGNQIPSVSEIVGIYHKNIDGFEDWICKQPDAHPCCTKAKRKFYKESADLGHDVHELMEAFLQGESFDDGVPEYQARLFEPIAKFFKQSGFKPMFIEEQMTGRMFGGTLDCAGTFSKPFWEEQRRTFWAAPSDLRPDTKDVWIVDLKIKSKLDVIHPLQLYGYKKLLKETKGIDTDWGLIIRRNKKLDQMPQLQLRAYWLPEYEDEWNASMKMHRFLNQ